MNELPKIVRARLNTELAGDHPDADQLAAFAEQALPERERAPLLRHLSRCADCRDVLALAMPPAGSAPASLDTANPVPWFRWPMLRWGAIAACVVVVGSAVLMKRDLMMTRNEQTAVIQSDARGDQAGYAPSSASRAAAPVPKARDQASMGSAVETPREDLAAPAQAKTLKRASPFKQPVAAPPPDVSEKKMALAAGGGRAHGTTFGAMASTTDQARQAPAAAPPNDQTNKLDVQSRNVSDLTIVPKMSETVEVQAGAPALETDAAAPVDTPERHETLGKAKSPSGTAMYDRVTEVPTPETVTAGQTVRSEEGATRANRERASLMRAPVSRWTISSDGQLQHSIDSGKTWQPVAVADHATFRALSANGPDLWVGGASGMLYHSIDAGARWTQVKPATAESSLTADIAAIEFTDARQGKITAANGEVWLTEDAGQTWHKQP